MDIFLLLGMFLGFGAIVTGMILKGASLAVLMNGEAATIIFVGIIAATINSFPKSEIKRLPKIFKVLFHNDTYEYASIIEEIINISNLARRNGLLSLEEHIQQLENPFLKQGLELVVDGIESEQIREILENQVLSMEERHRIGANMFKTGGTTSPTLGVLGAVIGLIGALGNLNNIDALGESISSAFVATLYGIFVGYVLLIPFSQRLINKSEAEVLQYNIIIEGILAIQAGQPANTIQQKLYSLVDEKPQENDEHDA